MIISASRKTDLPTFYADWFRHRLRAGYCRTVNAYNRTQHRRESLEPGDVDAFVFWTKNVGPFFGALAEVAERRIPFVVHHSVNGYPRQLEPSVVASDRAIEHCRRLAGEYGPRSVVWRYDPVLLSDLTPSDWHRRKFARLARALAGSTDEVAVKYANPYRKTRRNLDAAAREHGFGWWDPPDDEKAALLRDLAGIAAEHGIALRACCQAELLGGGVEPAVCIDVQRLADLAGRPFAATARPIRADCRCAANVDIGEYETCPHGCVYCYAVQRRATALARWRRHDPAGEYLFEPEERGVETGQMVLF